MSSQQLAWLGVAAVLIGLVVRLLKSDIPWTSTIPARWRPVLALGLGAVAAAFDAVLGGASWPDAIKVGLGAAAAAIVGHDVVIEGLRGGKELGGTSAPPPGAALLLLGAFFLAPLLACGLLHPSPNTPRDVIDAAGCIEREARGGAPVAAIAISCGVEVAEVIGDLLQSKDPEIHKAAAYGEAHRARARMQALPPQAHLDADPEWRAAVAQQAAAIERCPETLRTCTFDELVLVRDLEAAR